jgi:hydrogenase maturation protease
MMPTPGSVDRAPVLLLGLGNLLLGDDGAGLSLLERMRKYGSEWAGAVELMDGGTRGLDLLGEISGRQAVIVLDAVQMGDPPGTVHVLRKDEVLGLGGTRATTAHESNAKELFQIAGLLGDQPEEVVVIGIEPELVATGVGLTETVEAALDRAEKLALEQVAALVGLEK